MIKNIWIDTDLDSDDIMAIIMISRNKNINIVGISINSSGAINSRIKGVELLEDLRHKLNEDFVIVEGFNKYYGNSNNKYPRVIIKATQEGYLKSSKRTFWYPEEFKDKIKNHCKVKNIKNFELLILGAATNIAFWVDDVCSIMNAMIRKVYFSGSNLIEDEASKLNINGVKGNIKDAFGDKVSIYDNDVSEWNVFIDTLAFKKIIHFFKEKLHLVSLNATNDVPIKNKQFLDEVKKINNIKSNLFLKVIGNTDEDLKYIKLWDQSTTIAFLFMDCYKSKKINLDVVTEVSIDNDQNGKLFISCDGSIINFIYKINKNIVYREIVNTLKILDY